MIQRGFVHSLRRHLGRFPAVTVLGPRRSGRTTFVRATLPGWTDLDLERPSDAAPWLADPEARLDQLGDRIIFDEAQRVPALFPPLRDAIDRKRGRAGRFLLLTP